MHSDWLDWAHQYNAAWIVINTDVDPTREGDWGLYGGAHKFDLTQFKDKLNRVLQSGQIEEGLSVDTIASIVEAAKVVSHHSSLFNILSHNLTIVM
jgi:hypothetical protein